jgi:ComF family protein
MIRHFKDRAGFPEFRGLSNCFNEHFMHHYDDTASPLPELLLPVPLHPSRLRTRGYNQALLLARRLSRRSGIPVLENSCQRRRSGSSQRGLNAAERLYNMQGIFSPHACTALTPGRRLAIVDDVVTTTATTQAMAAVMHECAAGRIDVWALARSNHQPES